MSEKNVQIRIVMKNRATGEEHVMMAAENMARAFLGDFIVDDVMARGKPANSKSGTVDGTG